MCGIYGFISKNTTEQSLVQATDILNLRGPDSGGYFFKSPLGLLNWKVLM
jgi:asparagine synthetase B (glutamine-hydrolysing)